LSSENPSIFKLAEFPLAGALVAPADIISVKSDDAVVASLDDLIGIPTENRGPPLIGVCSMQISASVVDPLNVCMDGLVI
jgi:hypothetical protein